MPYQPTWNNPYLSGLYGSQSMQVPTQQYQLGYQPYNGIIKVNGPDSAMQFQLPPNSMSPALFDNNGRVFYIVSTDGTGTKTVETFNFSSQNLSQPDSENYVSKQEFDDVITQLKEAIDVIHGSIQPTVLTNESVSQGTADGGK